MLTPLCWGACWAGTRLHGLHVKGGKSSKKMVRLVESSASLLAFLENTAQNSPVPGKDTEERGKKGDTSLNKLFYLGKASQ